MRYGLLGTLEVTDDDGRAVDIGGAQPRMLLAMLLAAEGRIVPVDALIEGIWGEQPPGSAAGTLQSYVSRLRRELEPQRRRGAEAKVVIWEPPGYRLDVAPEQVDFRRFEDLAGEGRALLDAGRSADAGEQLAAAVALWRGPALLEFADHDFARGVATRLDERRLAAIEDRISADLALGRHVAVIGELTELVGEHPLRENLWALLALALYRAGRQSEALRALDDMRRVLRDELGVDPSHPLRDLEAQILEHDRALDPPEPPTTVSAADTSAPGPGAGALAPGRGIVGRDQELAQLVATFDETRAGRTRFAIVEGEPGIGKTRLLEELAAHATARGARVHWGRCHETGAAPAFWPWLEVLRPIVDEFGTDAHGEAHPGLDRVLNPGPTAPDEIARDTDRFALYQSVASTLGAAAEAQPVVVVIEDLQWADPASIDLLDFLSGAGDASVLVALSVREHDPGRGEALVGAFASMTRRHGTRRLALRGLGENDTAALVALATGARASDPVNAAIHARAEGNPFFVGELARLVVGDDANHGDADEEIVRRVGVPAGVRDVVRRRLALLPETTTGLLEVAAVLGRDAEIEVLAHAAGRDVETCLDDLEIALATRLLVEVPDAPSTFRFAHALVREVLLEALTTARRARVHLRAADAIVAVVGDADDTVELVAAHLWNALPLSGRPRTAAALERAAEVAMQRVAYRSAEPLLERAVQLRRSSGSDDAVAEAELLAIHRLLGVRRVLYSYAASFREISLERVQDLARRTGRLDVLDELLWAEWAAAATACDLVVAEPLAAQLLQLGLEAGSDAARALGLAAWGIHCWHVGRITEAAEHLDAAMAAMDNDQTFTPGAMVQQGILAVSFDVCVHELVGDRDDGEQRMVALAERQPDPFGQVVVWSTAAYAGMLAGDPVRAARAGRRAVEHDPEGTFPFQFFSASAANLLAGALTDLGEHEQALELFTTALPAYRDIGVRTVLPSHLANHAMALLAAGRDDEAIKEMGEAEAVLEEHGERWNEPYVLMRKAELIAQTGGSPDDVARLLTRAVEVATAQGAFRFARRAEALGRRLGAPLS